MLDIVCTQAVVLVFKGKCNVGTWPRVLAKHSHKHFSKRDHVNILTLACLRARELDISLFCFPLVWLKCCQIMVKRHSRTEERESEREQKRIALSIETLLAERLCVDPPSANLREPQPRSELEVRAYLWTAAQLPTNP